jgi:hypothetical protein
MAEEGGGARAKQPGRAGIIQFNRRKQRKQRKARRSEVELFQACGHSLNGEVLKGSKTTLAFSKIPLFLLFSRVLL